MSRMALFCGSAFLASAVLALASAVAASDYDNPRTGIEGNDVPCVVMQDYDVSSRGAGETMTHSARVTLENICGRAMDTQLCFYLMPDADGEGDTSVCSDLVVRPFGKEQVRLSRQEARVLTAKYQWRWLAY